MVATALVAAVGCGLNRQDADPQLETIEVTGATAGGSLQPGQSLTVNVSGTELWQRKIDLEVLLATSDASAPMSLERRTAQFNQTKGRQTATITWNVQGEVLRIPGKNRLFFRASYEGQQLDSDAFDIEVYPTVDAVRLVDLMANDTVSPRATITLQLEGRDVWNRDVTIEVYRLPEGTTQPLLVDEISATFDAAESMQSATTAWQVDGEILKRAGRNGIQFLAIMDDQRIESDTVYVDVVASIDAITVEYETPFEVLRCGNRCIFPVDSRLIVGVDTTALFQEEVRLDVYLVSAPTSSIASFRQTAQSPHLEFIYELDEQLATRDNVGLFFVASSGALTFQSPAVTAQRAGIHDCRWYDSSNTPIPPETTLGTGVSISMRGRIWGLAGTAGTFELWESDTGSDDFVSSSMATAEGDVIRLNWTTVFIDDGLFQTEDEYYFVLKIGGQSCRSPRLNVER